MGWRLGVLLGLLAVSAGLLACSGGCSGLLQYTSTVEAGATSCTVTLSNGDASISIAVGDMPAGADCGAPQMLGVSCNASTSSTLVCLRACSSFSVIGDGVAAQKVSAVLGTEAGSVAASVMCNGTAVPSAPKRATLIECAM